jgi:O-antigen/teichoic acid export membrane protein
MTPWILACNGRIKIVSLRRIVTGTAFVSSASVVRILSQFIALPILSRLLTSTDYGLVAIASPFIAFAMIITDAGLGMSLVRSTPVKDDTAWSTSFWVIFCVGSALAAILFVLSPLAAYVFGEPKLKLIVFILSFTIAAQAASVIPGAALQQARRFSTIAVIEISSTVLGIVLYSHMATIKDNLPAIRRTFLLVTRILGILVFPSLGMVAAAHDTIFKIVLSEKWAQSGMLFMILAAAGAVQAIMALGGDIMLILGRSDLRLRTTIEFSVIWLGALVAVIWAYHDIYWVGIAYNLAVVLYMPRTLSLVLSLIQCPFKTYLEAIFVPALMTPAAVFLHAEISGIFALQQYADIGLTALLILVTMALCALVQFRSLSHESALLAFLFRSNLATQ